MRKRAIYTKGPWPARSAALRAPLAGAVTAHINVAVVRVSAKAVASAFRFFVEVIEPEIAEERRERTALRGPFLQRADQAVFHHPSLQEGSDELEHALVGQPRGDPRQQAVVSDLVEKFFEIQVNHDAIALGDITLRLGDGLLGGAARAEAVAVLGKRRVPTGLKDLQQG